MARITLWHNPRCSKSRAALGLLEDGGAEVEIRKYLDDVPSETELRAVATALGKPASGFLRKGEPDYKVAGLNAASDDDAILRAMARHPKLIERPIAILGDRAVLGRPPEDVLALLK